MGGNVFKNPGTPQDAGRSAERKACKRLQGRLMPGSGAMDGAKSDFTTANFRVESKATQAKSMSIKLDWLQKISQEALERSQVPAIAIQFVDAQGDPRKDGVFIAIPEWALQELLE